MKKYQIFVSSTFRDLIDERNDAIKSILDLKHIPAGMELFPAADFDQMEYIKRIIDECDYYLLIIGGRYGSVDLKGISYTEREYDYAHSQGKTVLCFPHQEPDSLPVSKSETSPEAVAALQAFRKKVMTGRMVRQWTTRQNLESLVVKTLSIAFLEMPQVGWIRATEAASPQILQEKASALRENVSLRAELEVLRAHGAPRIAEESETTVSPPVFEEPVYDRYFRVYLRPDVGNSDRTMLEKQLKDAIIEIKSLAILQRVSNKKDTFLYLSATIPALNRHETSLAIEKLGDSNFVAGVVPLHELESSWHISAEII